MRKFTLCKEHMLNKTCAFLCYKHILRWISFSIRNVNRIVGIDVNWVWQALLMWPCVNVVFPLLSSRCLSNYTLSSFTIMILFHCLFQKLEILWMCYVLNLKSVVSLFLAKFSSFNFTATVLVPLLMSSLDLPVL